MVLVNLKTSYFPFTQTSWHTSSYVDLFKTSKRMVSPLYLGDCKKKPPPIQQFGLVPYSKAFIVICHHTMVEDDSGQFKSEIKKFINLYTHTYMRHTTHFIFMKGRSSKVYPLRYYGYCWCVWTASRYLQFRSLKKLTRRHNTRYSIQKKRDEYASWKK